MIQAIQVLRFHLLELEKVVSLLVSFYPHIGVDISFTVCLCVCVCVCVCTDTDFSAEDKASGVTFCSAVHRRPRQRITNYLRTLLPKKPKIGQIGQRAGNAHPDVKITVEMRRRKLHARDAPFVEFKHVCNISRSVWT